jgi:hypothetical protein
MADTTLLKSVLSDKGWYCIIGIKDGYVKTTFWETLEEAENEIDRLLDDEQDVYFGCSKFKTNKDRKQPNVDNVKAFWVDIDCGETKPYRTQADGAAALATFCEKAELPRPTVVNSGRGIHAYWILENEISREEWKPVAETLKDLCNRHGLDADPAVTADESRILRVPGTLNFKADPPLEVKVLVSSKPVNFFEFCNKLGPIKQRGPDQSRQPLNELTLALMGNQEHKFSVIMMKTQKGNGCAQLGHIEQNQEEIEEPLWRAGLSIAAYCADKETAIHRISDKYSKYDFDETVRKANETKGPYTCDKFDGLRSGVCSECPHKGKIKSPIVLGREILEATEEDNIVEIAQPLEDKPVLVQIPTYPRPYFRGKNGGVYVAFDEEDPKLIYEHDLYVVKRMEDPVKGIVILLRLHLPRDGTKEFTIPLTETTSKEKLANALSFNGVIAVPKSMANILAYIVSFVKELTFSSKVEIMRTQFGWADNNKKFILGDKEVSADGTRYSPPSSQTAGLAPAFEPVGTLEDWKKIVNVYDMPGFEPHAFGFFTAFGAPLLKFLNLNGALVNMISNESGTGKTTVLKAMHSVYSHPEQVMLNWKDTTATKIHRFGILNNLPPGCDEITKMNGDELSDLAYSTSQGRGRNRMRSQENSERVNLTKWSTICLCTSNASAIDKLKALKATPDGELMRIIEYSIRPTDNLTKEQADAIFSELYNNYGHAGYQYIKWLVGNLEEAIDDIKKVQVMLDTKLKLTNRERFWSAVVACNIGGAFIAKKLGLHDIDVNRVFNWASEMIRKLRMEITPPTEEKTGYVGEFINENINSMAIVNGELDKRTNVEALPIMEPRSGKLVIRMEPDTRKLFIATKPFREYCAESQINIKELLGALTSEGIYIGTEKKRMAKGTKVASPAVYAYVFDCSVPDFIDPAEYVESAEALKEIVGEDSRNKL